MPDTRYSIINTQTRSAAVRARRRWCLAPMQPSVTGSVVYRNSGGQQSCTSLRHAAARPSHDIRCCGSARRTWPLRRGVPMQWKRIRTQRRSSRVPKVSGTTSSTVHENEPSHVRTRAKPAPVLNGASASRLRGRCSSQILPHRPYARPRVSACRQCSHPQPGRIQETRAGSNSSCRCSTWPPAPRNRSSACLHPCSCSKSDRRRNTARLRSRLRTSERGRSRQLQT